VLGRCTSCCLPPIRLLAVLALLSFQQAVAVEYDLMLDKSGSMAGFARTEDATWTRLIEGLESGASSRYAFGDDVVRLQPGQTLLTQKLDDNLTKIGDAMDRWIKDSKDGDTLVIITDNVVDYGSAEKEAEQGLFYQHLVGSESYVSEIGVLLVRLPFRGRIYPLRGGGFADYDGKRALVLYVFSRFNEDGFNALMARVEGALRSAGVVYHPIRVKPFDKSTFKTRGPDGETPVNVPEHLLDKIRIKDGTIWLRNLEVGDEVDFPLEVAIHSNSNFGLTDVRAEPFISFANDRSGFVKQGDFETKITPPSADIPAGATQLFTVRVQGSHFTVPGQNDVFKQALLSLGDAKPITGELSIRFLANISNIDLSKALLSEWSHTQPDELGNPTATDVHDRVYMLERLVTDLLPGKTVREEELLNERYGIHIALSYPLGPLLGLLFAAAVLAAVAYFAYKWLSRRREFALYDEYGAVQRFVPGLFSTRRIYAPQSGRGGLVFKMTYWFFGFLLSPGKGYRIEGSAFISGQGDTIRVVSRGADDYEILVWDLRTLTTSGGRAGAAGGGDPGWNDDWR